MGNGPNQDAGTCSARQPAPLSAALGSGSGGVAAGAVVGGFIGNEIGADLDAADRRMAADAEYRALEFGRTGAPVGWHGRSGRYGDVVAGSSYRVNDYNCRDYTHTIYIDGRPEVGPRHRLPSAGRNLAAGNLGPRPLPSGGFATLCPRAADRR